MSGGYPIYEENHTMHTPYWWYIYLNPKKIAENNIKMNAILSDIDETKPIIQKFSESKKSISNENSTDDGFKLSLDSTKKMNKKSNSKEESDIFKLTIPIAETMEIVGKENLPLTESLDITNIVKKEDKSNIIIKKETIDIIEPTEKQTNKINYRLYLIIILVILCFIFLFY
jgi:hypothetical protein